MALSKIWVFAETEEDGSATSATEGSYLRRRLSILALP